MALGRTVVVAASAAALATFPLSARADTYGANLNRPANGAATCSQPFLISALPNWWTIPTDSCTVFSSTSVRDPFHPEGTVSPPGNGVIKRVRIKVGSRTAPMRIVILRALRTAKGGEASCCTGRSRSKIFTPKANATTTVNVTLPVVAEFDTESRLWNFDIVALTVFGSNVPIPAYDSGDPYGTCSSIYSPSIDSGQERNVATNNGACGYTVLMSVDWVPGPAAQVVNNTARVSRGVAPFVVRCLQDAVCRGRLQLLSQRPAGAQAAGQVDAAGIKSYGSATFKVGANKSGKVRVKLSNAGKALLRKNGSASVWAYLSGKAGSKKISSATRVRLAR